MTMQVDKARLDEMLRGLEGVTPGPWEVAAPGTYPEDEGAKVLGPQGYNSNGHPVRYYVAQFVRDRNVSHIARCDPDTMRSIITELLELRSLRSTEGKEARDVHELEASVSALEEECQSLIATKREQIKRLERERDAALTSAKAARENFLTMQGSAAQLLARAEAAEAHVAKLSEALEFYRDGFTFTTNAKYGGLEWSPTEALLDDCGNVARAALTRSPE